MEKIVHQFSQSLKRIHIYQIISPCMKLLQIEMWAVSAFLQYFSFLHLALKELSHEMDLALMTCVVTCRPKQGTRPVFKFFRCYSDFFTQSVFLAVNASLCWLNNVTGVRLTWFLIGQQGLVQFFRYRPLIPIGWRIVQISCRCRRKTTNIAPTTLRCNTSSKPIHFNQCTIICTPPMWLVGMATKISS